MTATDHAHARAAALTDHSLPTDLARSVYCILGIPIDAVSMTEVIQCIEATATNRTAFLISTPNLNFLVRSLLDADFRESLLESNLCSPDGIAIVWIARLLGLPINQRVTGADILAQLRSLDRRSHRLSLFLFGGAEGAAAAAAKALNAQKSGLTCVGTINPGFGEVKEMSQDHIINAINSSNADFLAVALGAHKGQMWLHMNHNRLTIPIRAHLGAAINFEAGTLKRAPQTMQTWGFEWLWRISQEPYLWKRYWMDGLVLLRLLLTRVLPLAIRTRWYRLPHGSHLQSLTIQTSHTSGSVTIRLSGPATERHIREAILCFQEALACRKNITIDLSNTSLIDARFFGLLLMLRKQLKAQGTCLMFVGVSRAHKRMFRLHELYFLLPPRA